jgi:hypothetical protein
MWMGRQKIPIRRSEGFPILREFFYLSHLFFDDTYGLRALLAPEGGKTHANLRYLVQIH